MAHIAGLRAFWTDWYLRKLSSAHGTPSPGGGGQVRVGRRRGRCGARGAQPRPAAHGRAAHGGDSARSELRVYDRGALPHLPGRAEHAHVSSFMKTFAPPPQQKPQWCFRVSYVRCPASWHETLDRGLTSHEERFHPGEWQRHALRHARAHHWLCGPSMANTMPRSGPCLLTPEYQTIPRRVRLKIHFGNPLPTLKPEPQQSQ